MKNLYLIGRGALICLLVGWGGMAAIADSKEPILKLDFDNGSAAIGIGGSACYDFSPAGQKPLVMDDPELMEKLSGIKSLTISGWVKRPASFDDVSTTPPCLLACPGIFEVRFDKWGRLALLMTGADGRRKQVWSSWISYADLGRDNRWVFFAFTYDGTKEGLNAAFYYGYESYVVIRDTFKTADAGQNKAQPDEMWGGGVKGSAAAGQLSPKPPPYVVVGSCSPDGSLKLSGAMDHIKIFASREGGSAALNQSDIEMIRRADVGAEYSRNLKMRALDTAQQKKMEQMQMEDTFWSDELNLHQVDSLTRIFTTQCPRPVNSDFIPCVPRGSSLPVLFSAMYRGSDALLAQIDVSPVRSENGEEIHLPFKSYEVAHVPVEANNNGGIRTTIDSRPPEIWQETLVAIAPFKIAEVLREARTLQLRMNNMHAVLYKGVLLDFEIPQDATPGLYRGRLTLKTDEGNVEAPFCFRVADVVLDEFPRLDNIYWFKAIPENLSTNPNLPEPWSDAHWELIRNSAKTLRDFGQTGITINLLSQNAETMNFIQTYRTKDGGYRFDYSMFDQWFKTFLDLGFRQIEGAHLFGSHKGRVLDVYAIEEKTGEKSQIFSNKSSMDDWIEFLKVFASDLCRHLDEKGWRDYYYQALIDEPTNLPIYKKARAFTDEYMPEIPIKDACGNSDYSDYMDIQVFNMSLAKQSYQNLAVTRRAAGKSVWLYHCASPYPPYPNRHLDEALSNSRLYPWLCYLLNADGYLYWAANNYRFADPYTSSIGPLPNGGTYPGHPPGDDWMYYPGPDGLRGSIRMLAFREGLLDHALLVQLAEKDPVAADGILKTIIRHPLDYSMEPSGFHAARRSLLNAIVDYNSRPD